MRRLSFALAFSLFAFSCESTQRTLDEQPVPIGTMYLETQDTPPPIEVDPDYLEDYHPGGNIPDSMANRGYSREQGDSIKRAMTVPPQETPGKGYDGRLPKDSAERARMIRIRELQRVRDSLWREQEYGKMGR